jgi:LacI family transcriptional regulator
MAMKPRRSVTIQEVAERAGVSLKTVSRVINNEPFVQAETRERVQRAVEALNYRPNLNARGLAGDRSYLIGLFYDQPGDYLADFQAGAVERCRESGFHLMVEPWDSASPDIARQVTTVLGQLRLEAAILLPPLSDHQIMLERLRQAEVPIVRVAPTQPLEDSPAIRIDDYSAAREMTEHLLGLGHRRIGFILGRAEHGATEQRRRGFFDAMTKAGAPIDPELVLPGNFLFSDGVACAERMLDAAEPPTAIFASNDDTAAAAISVAQRRGLRLPEQLSVVGFDDAPVASMIWPTLTTIRQPVASMARSAVDMVIESAPKRNGWPTPLPDRTLNYELIKRCSAAPPPGR